VWKVKLKAFEYNFLKWEFEYNFLKWELHDIQFSKHSEKSWKVKLKASEYNVLRWDSMKGRTKGL